MKTQSLKSSVVITRALLVLVALSTPLAAGTVTPQSVSAPSTHAKSFASGWTQQASAKWSAFLSAQLSVTPKTCVYINGWTLPDNPVVGQGYPITWHGYTSGSSPLMLYTKAPGSSLWAACGSGGIPPGGGLVAASGSFGFYVSGTWQFAYAPSNTTPTFATATLVVP